jgi:Zn-dependent oligopeptidase
MVIYQDLLGLTFKKIEKPSVWHKDVTMYAVNDLASKKLLGHFYLDLYPRDDKFNHAACMTILMRHRKSEKDIKLGSAAMVANLNPPKGDEPSLLSH